MGYHDQMQVCENGHLITDRANSYPQFRANFCKSCGAKTIDACSTCGSRIKGDYISEGVFGFSATPVPSYCENCGAAYPWQQSAIDNFTEALRESEVSEPEITAIASTLPDILRDTPKTDSAALRLRRLLGQLGKPAYEIAVKVLTDIASETAKKAMGLTP